MCFVDPITRDQYWKVGAEAIGVLIEKRPELLGDVLRLIDRNIDQLDQVFIGLVVAYCVSDIFYYAQR